MTRTDLERLENRLHELEREVLKEQRFMHDFIERANLMVVGLDAEGLVTIFNQTAEAVSGYSKEDVLGRPVGEAFGPQAGNTVHTLADKLRVCGGSPFRADTQLVTKSGQQRRIVWHASCLSDGDAVIGLVAFGEDRTAAERYEHLEQWQATMDVLQRFAGDVAHGLNNLLGTVLGYASLLHETCGRGEEAEYAAQIETGVRRCAHVLGRLLGFARGGTTKPERVELGDTVRQAVARFQAKVPPSITIEYGAGDEPVHVAADPRQLGQVLDEVIGNAVEALPEGGRIIVSARAAYVDAAFCIERPGLKQGWYAAASVTDNGPGILPSEARDLILPLRTTKREQWAGLGLSIAYGVLRKHDGWLDIQGIPGTGTTVTLYLPLSGTEVKRHAPPEAERKGPQTILLVDDEKVLVDAVSDMLKHLGYLVLTAGDGDEAVQIYEEHKANVDLIILDMIMPRRGGRETYEDLKDIQPDVKVLLTSGFDEQKVVAQGMCDRGAAGFVEKPYRLKELSTLIRSVIEQQT